MSIDRPVPLPFPGVQHLDLYFDPSSYSAFPHVIRLDGDELLLSFRQAPRTPGISHTHPRSIITVARSYDIGETWDFENATQVAAGGGQELGLIHLGGGKVGGALARHEVVPERETARAGIRSRAPDRYPYRRSGLTWIWSEDWGLTWPSRNSIFVDSAAMPCAWPIRLRDGQIACPAYGDGRGGEGMSSVVYFSGDEGRSWSAPETVAAGILSKRQYCEPAIVEVAPGRLRALHRVEFVYQGRAGHFWSNESPDGGVSWSEPEETGILSGACPRLLSLSDRRLLLTYGRRAAPFGLCAVISEDGGATWRPETWLLRPAPNANQGYTSSVELGEGRILTLTYMENEAGVTGIAGVVWRPPS